jgi:hypothetical protein
MVGADGEWLALTAWPLLLLLALMAASLLCATRLARRAAALPALILPLLFFDPLIAFLPGSIDHHNAQVALVLVATAAALYAGARPAAGWAAGVLVALMLAVGLETLPYAALLGAWVALAWAFGRIDARGAVGFGTAVASGAPALVALAGSPAAWQACDVLSFAYLPSLIVAGGGLAALAILLRRSTAPLRLAGLGGIALASAGALLIAAPQCRAGPYAALSAAMKTLFLARVSEALPLLTVLRADPAGTLAAIGPVVVALFVGIRRVHGDGVATPWLLPAAIIAVALAASFYQVRTLPFAAAAAVPVLAAWLGGLSVAARPPPLPRLAAATLASLPPTWLAVGWLGVWTAGAVSGGRVAPPDRMEARLSLTAGLAKAEAACVDPASAALLNGVAKGLVLSPVFYGPSVLALSHHASVAAPYHRAAGAVLDGFDAFLLPPERAHEVLRRRGVDYLAFCATAKETAIAIGEAPDGMLARLAEGESIAWLQPIPGKGTMLRLYRVAL